MYNNSLYLLRSQCLECCVKLPARMMHLESNTFFLSTLDQLNPYCPTKKSGPIEVSPREATTFSDADILLQEIQDMVIQIKANGKYSYAHYLV